MVVRPSVLAAAAVLGLLGSTAHASPTDAGALELRANAHTIAVAVPYAGDDDRDATATLETRAVGTETWQPGHPPARTDFFGQQRRWATVVVGLQPDAEVEVRIAIDDPDGERPAVRQGTITTRTPPSSGGSATLFVALDGDDAGTGTSVDPFATIQHAVDVAAPGDVVEVAPGVYAESVVVLEGGDAASPVVVRGQEPGAAVLDGRDPSVDDSGWREVASTDDGAPVWMRAVPPGFSGRRLIVDGQRLYTYDSLDELLAGAADLASASEITAGYYGDSVGGFVHDAGAGQIYARLPDGGDPAGRDVAAPMLDNGLVIRAAGVVIDGLAIENYGPSPGDGTGRCIEVVDAQDVVLRNNTLAGCHWGVRARRSARVWVEDNHLVERLPYALAWDGEYGAYNGGAGLNHSTGIDLQGAWEDAVVRRNVVEGFVDGIVVGNGLGAPGLRTDNFDIHHNRVTQARDDAIELDGNDVAARCGATSCSTITPGSRSRARRWARCWCGTTRSTATSTRASSCTHDRPAGPCSSITTRRSRCSTIPIPRSGGRSRCRCTSRVPWRPRPTS